MKKLNNYKNAVKPLNTFDIHNVKGGSFAYDLGWAIHWTFTGAFSGDYEDYASAVAAYAAHYAQE